MLKKTAQIEIFGEKITNKNMQTLAEDAIRGKNRKTPVTIRSFLDGQLSETLFSNNGQFYVNPTEALKMREFVSDGDTVATVLASGDFSIDALHSGARNIVTFDINRLQYPIALLKLSGLQVLNYEDYFSFFSDVNSDMFLSPEVYKVIASKANNPLLRAFCDTFMKQRVDDLRRLHNDSNYNFFLYCREKFHSGELTKEMLTSMGLISEDLDILTAVENMNEVYFDKAMKETTDKYVPLKTTNVLRGEGGKRIEGSYLENSTFYEMAVSNSKISRISYIKSNMSAFMVNLKRSGYITSNFNGFNTIYLSNIPEYMSGEAFTKIVKEQLMPILKEDGSIVYCCQGVDKSKLLRAGIDDYTKAREEICRTRQGRDIFNDINEVNDMEAYDLLRREYNISFSESESFCADNGNDDVDTFVRVMKK